MPWFQVRLWLARECEAPVFYLWSSLFTSKFQKAWHFKSLNGSWEPLTKRKHSLFCVCLYICTLKLLLFSFSKLLKNSINTANEGDTPECRSSVLCANPCAGRPAPKLQQPASPESVSAMFLRSLQLVPRRLPTASSGEECLLQGGPTLPLRQWIGTKWACNRYRQSASACLAAVTGCHATALSTSLPPHGRVGEAVALRLENSCRGQTRRSKLHCRR